MRSTASLTNTEGTTEAVKNVTAPKDLGIQLKPIDNTVKEALGIDSGLEVTAVNQGKFKDQGVQQGYIILKINNQAMSSVNDFEKVYNEASKAKKALSIAGVYPTTGKIAYYKIELDK